MPLDNCRIVDLPQIKDIRGSLSFIENNNLIPFSISRAYFLYDIPAGVERGSHAHKNLQQFIVPLAGSFDVVLDDGVVKKRFHLNRPYQGLIIGPLVWRLLDNFSSGAVCLVLASEKYNEDDYIRSYEQFMKYISSKK
jgi:hypothetical protein